MNTFQKLFVIVTLSLLLVACSNGDSPESEARSEGGSAVIGDGFPPMGVAELDTYLAENAGTPTMLFFWATWCPSCKQALPEMVHLQQTDGGRVNIITVSLDEDIKALEKYFTGKKRELPVYHGDLAIAKKFNVQAIPTLALFDRTGKLVFSQPGVFPYGMLQGMVEKLAKK